MTWKLQRHTVYLLQASTCRVLCLRTAICGQHWFFVITWRKLLQNRIECLSKLTVNMLLAKHSISSGEKWRSWKTTEKVRRLGSEGCYLLWPAKTWWNCQHESLPRANDRFKSSIARKTTGLSKKATQSHFSSR